ncbi:uncharacterized protein LOC133337229 [Musca vetustissima]|uniref:uncharacterized protein LOC133337229 n=1 Tax=Musca vetustissima TaxID=27455 RepID=UPI002AB7DD14|nr:uncharacterized protein LOC133337229 [Musca vetustissima]
MFSLKSLIFVVCSMTICCQSISAANDDDTNDYGNYRPSPKLSGPVNLAHSPDDITLNQLDECLAKISSIYMQALFSGTHSPELDVNMRKLEIELFDLLDLLYKEQRIKEYMKYESEVTRQMIIYNMLKRLFGYAEDEEEKSE